MDIIGKRKKFLIKRTLQFKFLFIIFMTMVTVLLITLWNVYYAGIKAITELNHPKILQIVSHMTDSIMLQSVIAIAIVLIASVFLSHKFAGPIYRFEEATKIIGKGDLTYRVKLRKGDELSELQDCFNDMTESLRNKIKNDDAFKV